MVDFTRQSHVRFKRGSLHGSIMEAPSDGKWASTHYHTTLKGTETYKLKLGRDGVVRYVFEKIDLAIEPGKDSQC